MVGGLHRRRAWSGVIALVSAVMLSGCDPKPSKKGLDCFPPEATPWIYLANDTMARPEGAPHAGHATIYVDHSASMAGYVAGDTTVERPFHDLVHTLPQTLREIAATSDYRAFGATISDVVADPRIFDSPAYFSCAAKGDAGCESHIDQVLTRVADQPGELAVMLSDLWFDNSQSETSGLADLKPPLARILASGRTVAIYGVAAPFSGKIYDLPTGNPATATVTHVGRHPLFMLVVGSKTQVLAFDKQLGRSGSGPLAQAATNGTIRRSIFTVAPGPDHPRQRAPMDAGTDPLFKTPTNETFGKASIQRFRLGEGAMFGRIGKSVGPSWTGPRDDAFIDYAVWQGKMTPRTRIWQRRSEQCSKDAWTSLGTMEGGWSDAEGGKQRFSLDPARFYGRVRRNGTYLLTGELLRSSVDSPNPANAWMREWNLTPGAAAMAAARPPMLFPTLNLAEVARIMEGSLATAAERHGGGITGFSILVKVDR